MKSSVRDGDKVVNQSYNTQCFVLPSWKMLVEAVACHNGGKNQALATIIANKNTLATIIANKNTLATIIANKNTLATIIANKKNG